MRLFTPQLLWEGPSGAVPDTFPRSSLFFPRFLRSLLLPVYHEAKLPVGASGISRTYPVHIDSSGEALYDALSRLTAGSGRSLDKG